MRKRKETTKSYKYHLHSLLLNLPVNEYQNAMNFFPVSLGVASTTWKAWIYIKQDEHREISGKALLMIAEYFQIPARNLFIIQLPNCTIVELRKFHDQKNLEYP